MQSVYVVTRNYIFQTQFITIVIKVFEDYEEALDHAIAKNKEAKEKKMDKGFLYYDVQENPFKKSSL